MKVVINKFTYTFVALLVLIVGLFISLCDCGITSVHAATSITQFEQTNVLDDLQSATVNGKAFNIANYPYDSKDIVKHPEVLTVVEYCYSVRPAHRNNYGVYIYFYNPQALNISTESVVNKIMLGVAYSNDKDGNLKVDDYEKFALQFCSKSTGDYHDLFYKFKVIDHKSADGKTIAERVNSNARRYDISEIELLTVGDSTATAYGVGGTYTFTGYAAGYGVDQNAESTLACERADLETITLDIAGVTDGIDKRTYWRSNSSSTGAHHQNQINSVFFAIDTTVLEKYGYTLQRIKAEWYEYKTAPTIVIDDKSIYDRLSVFNGVKIPAGYAVSRGLSLHNKDFVYIGNGFGSSSRYQYTWNASLSSAGMGGSHVYSSDYIDLILPLLFYTYGVDVDDYFLSAETLRSYCENYSKSYYNGHLQFGAHDFSADLFIDSVDSGRIRGYNLREFDITNPDDLWQINSYDSSHNWWQKFLDYGFGSITTNDDYSDVLPIQMLKAEDFAVSDVANHLHVNPDDVNRLKDYYYDSVKDKNHDGKPDNAVFIFRYAQTDYWAEDLSIWDIENEKSCPGVGEVRQGTQFFDFDILTLTFNKDGDLTTLGCVMSPVDHWSGYSPSIEPTSPDWWKWLKIVLGVIVALLLLFFLLPILAPIIVALVKALLWLLLLPFRLIGTLFKGLKYATSKDKRR